MTNRSRIKCKIQNLKTENYSFDWPWKKSSLPSKLETSKHHHQHRSSQTVFKTSTITWAGNINWVPSNRRLRNTSIPSANLEKRTSTIRHPKIAPRTTGNLRQPKIILSKYGVVRIQTNLGRWAIAVLRGQMKNSIPSTGVAQDRI